MARMKFFLETMGCQMNKLDSELVAAALVRDGHEAIGDSDSADIILYNTCSVREHAENKVLGRLGRQTRRKRDGKRVIVVVFGCMAQRLGDELVSRFDGVDIVCGTGRIDSIAPLVAERIAGGRRVAAVDPPRAGRGRAYDCATNARLEAMDADRPTPEGQFQAFVRVQRGCDTFCSYCIVPFVRGSEQSRDPRGIVEEVKRLADSGCIEVTLIGQTVNHYQYDSDGKTVRMGDLLEMVNAVDGLQRIKFVTSYPAKFDRDIFHAMADLPKVCEYLHMPCQSGSDRMLKAMNRRYTVSDYIELLDAGREIVPGLTVAGDFIVGFPGETEEDFQASCELTRRARYRNSFIFKYSPRSGTASAEKLCDDVSEDEKKRRNNLLLAVQNEISQQIHDEMLGGEFEVLVESLSPRSARQPVAAPTGCVQLQGRTRGDHIVVFDGPKTLIGTIQQVKPISATPLAMTGELIKP